jgi:DNA-binding NarL/FixJ family response regulator
VSPAVRVVLADASSSGTLHYLLEAEGFQVVGSASNEWELRRLLRQDIRPDVVVLDRDITVASVAIASSYAPDAQIVVLWPDGVQAPTGARRVAPWLIYRELGPTIRASLDRPVEVEASAGAEAVGASEPTADVVTVPTQARPAFGRTAARTSVMAIVLIAAVVMTMGAVMAVGGQQVQERQAARRMAVSQSSDDVAVGPTSTPHGAQPSGPPVKTPMACEHGPRWSSNDRAADLAPGAHDKRCPARAGGTQNKPAHAGHSQRHHAAGQPSDPGQSNDEHGGSSDTHGQADAHRQNDTTGTHNDGPNAQGSQHGQGQRPSDAPATDHGPKT